MAFFLSVQANAYLIECKGLNDDTKQVRLIQQIPTLPIIARIQRTYDTFNFGATFQMKGAEVVFKDALPSQLQWSNENYDVDLTISNKIVRENPKVRPFGYKSILTFKGSGNSIIDSEDFICRYFQM